MPHSPKSMGVLLVRPEQPRDAFVDKLVGIGAQVFRYPVMEILPVSSGQPMEAIKSQIMDFDHYQIAIFISRNAARFGLAWLDDYWPMLPVGVR
ncbi:MAG: uroporphyrinogen-III synthase, partial [Gammaproteobacteria bacterium]